MRDLYRRLVERVGEADSNGLDLDVLTPGARALYVLMTAVDLVGTGGFELLFYDAPALALEAPSSAGLVKARKFMDIFEQANAIAFEQPPRKRRGSEYRRMLRAVYSRGDTLAMLDNEFDALMANSATRIEASVLRYIEHNPQDFAGV